MKNSTEKTHSELIVKATESMIEARNCGYKDCGADISIKVTKEETERYTYMSLKGYESAIIAVNLKSIFSVKFDIKINSNDDVNISIYKG